MNHTIAETARALGVTPDTLRYYEREGLLPEIARDASGRRVYTDHQLDQLRVVGTLREAGFGIATIRGFLGDARAGGTVGERLAEASNALSALEAELAQRQDALDRARELIGDWRRELTGAQQELDPDRELPCVDGDERPTVGRDHPEHA